MKWKLHGISERTLNKAFQQQETWNLNWTSSITRNVLKWKSWDIIPVTKPSTVGSVYRVFWDQGLASIINIREIRENSSSNSWEQIQKSTAKHWADLGESEKEVEEGLEKPGESETPQEYGP